MTSLKTLMRDEELTIFEQTTETLTEEGYHCLVAIDVDSAVEIIIAPSGIKLFLTDFRMPADTSADWIKIVKSTLKQKAKFIVMSGHARPAVEKNSIDLSHYSFLKKSLDIASLTKKVTSVLEGKK